MKSAYSSADLTSAERLKFALMAEGIYVSSEARRHIDRPFGERPTTLADYASTSGIGLVFEDDVWVNAPINEYNPNFVIDPRFELVLEGDRLNVRDRRSRSEMPAQFVPIPAYHDQRNAEGELYTSYAHTHTDRVRISPIQGCAMRCRFCDIPYEFKGRYLAKPAERLIDAAKRALNDPVQAAAHVLISGGTPGRRHYTYLRELYRAAISGLAGTPVDIMMVPSPEIIDLDGLNQAGVNELSLNIEVFNQRVAREITPEKYEMGLDACLDFIGKAVELFGTRRVRSMLVVGLEPIEDTLAGVKALVERGCTPVLSPFRPDPITDLRNVKPPTASMLEDVYLKARDIAGARDIRLGPGCIPCSHNTVTLADGSDHYFYHGHPRLLG